MAALIGALRASLSLDSAKFSEGMKKSQRQASTSAAAINKSLGTVKAGMAGFASAISVGILATGIKAALDYAGGLGEISQQLGVTTRDLQVFRYAAGQTGISQEEMDKGLGKLTVTLGQVAAGAKAPTKALKAIGIEAKDLAGLDTGAAFRKIADGLAPITDRAKRAAVEVALFGRTGAKLDTLLSGGSGAINELARAADELGIVLSDSQIQNADKTADKLEAVKTVLAAQISGVVADNASSILTLSSALASLTSSIVNFLGSNPMGALAILGALAGGRLGGLPGAAAGAFAGATAGASMGAANQAAALTTTGVSKDLLKRNFIKAAREAGSLKRAGKPFGAATARARRLKQKYDSAAGVAPVVPAGFDPGQFLAGDGPKARKPKKDRSAEEAERKRLEAIREAYRLAEDDRRADMDILRAKQALAPTYVERAAIEMQMLDAERGAYVAELANNVAMGEMQEADAQRLLAKYDIADGLRRQAVNEEENEQRQREYNALDDKDFEIKRDILAKQAGLAETAGERRALELEILKLEYDHRKMVLERIMRESKDYAEIESARRELANLPAQQRADTQGVMNSTRGPMEEYLAGVPDTAAKMEEALQGVKVNAIDGIVQGLTDAATGAQKLGDVFKNVANQIIQDLLRIMIQKAITGALSSALGGGGLSFGSLTGGGGSSAGDLPAFATGGSFSILGKRGTDRNIMSLNGLPIARVSHGERVNIGTNDNINGRGGKRLHFDLRGAVMTPDLIRQMNEIGETAMMGGGQLGTVGGQQALTRQQRRAIP